VGKYDLYQLVQLPRFSGGEREVTVYFDGLSCLERVEAKRRIYPYTVYSEKEFSEALLDWFLRGKGITWPPHSVERGLIRKAHFCPQCGKQVDKVETKTMKLDARIDSARIPPFDIGVEVPGVMCLSCGLSQVLADPAKDTVLNFEVRVAMILALNNAGITP